jgi:hypothetical protein
LLHDHEPDAGHAGDEVREAGESVAGAAQIDDLVTDLDLDPPEALIALPHLLDMGLQLAERAGRLWGEQLRGG